MNNVEIVAERPVGWLNGRVRVAVGKVDGFRVELDTADRTDQILALPLAFFDRLVQFAQANAALISRLGHPGSTELKRVGDGLAQLGRQDIDDFGSILAFAAVADDGRPIGFVLSHVSISHREVEPLHNMDLPNQLGCHVEALPDFLTLIEEAQQAMRRRLGHTPSVVGSGRGN